MALLLEESSVSEPECSTNSLFGKKHELNSIHVTYQLIGLISELYIM